MDSFEECVERLYTDSGLGDELDSGRVVLGPDIDERLIALRRLLTQIDRHGSIEARVEDPALEHLRQAAADIRRDLDA